MSEGKRGLHDFDRPAILYSLSRCRCEIRAEESQLQWGSKEGLLQDAYLSCDISIGVSNHRIFKLLASAI
jgi:hypothetical protein